MGNMKPLVRLEWDKLRLPEKVGLTNFCISVDQAENEIDINGIFGERESITVLEVSLSKIGKIEAKTGHWFYSKVYLTEESLRDICRVG